MGSRHIDQADTCLLAQYRGGSYAVFAAVVVGNGYGQLLAQLVTNVALVQRTEGGFDVLQHGWTFGHALNILGTAPTALWNWAITA